jgi:tetratricopeptide (TPR) repeat protein
MTEQEYKQKIDEAFAHKKYDDVILYENDLMFLAYADLAKLEGIMEQQEAYGLPNEKIYAYFQNHDYAPIITKKGISSMHMGDFSLARQSLEAAIGSLRPDNTFADPYVYLAYLQYSENLLDMASKTLREGLRRYPKLLENFDQMFDEFLGPISLPETKEKFKTFCQKLNSP